ncbi:SHOCT domain-containing protein [uncultured Methanobrevibacter sp.]|uniref:SHOCT domain-containing protein n=1 Tax=uncultured Methanobrevibacter sp. TaxID=253161 RepID=UPI002623F155
MKREENEFDFMGLLTEEISGKKDKSNGVIRLDDSNVYVEKRSRFNGKVKDSYTFGYDDLGDGFFERLALNKIELKLPEKTLLLKTMDHGMLDDFELKLSKKLGLASNQVENVENAENVENVEKEVKIVSNPNPTMDVPEEIRKYHGLYKDGIITEEEFEAKKKELLNL